ncbi:MAG: phosphoglycolate phosphatase [Halobacteriota archaeon]
MIKAVAFDIDGTLTFPDRSLELTVVSAIRQLTVPIVLATGNVLCVAHTLAVSIGNISGVIAENGGIVTAGKSKLVSGNNAACRRAAQVIEGSGEFTLQRINSKERVTEIAYSKDNLSTSDVESLRRMVAQCCDGVTVVDSGFALHLKDARVNKGVGLISVAQLFGVAVDEFAAFGDAENDVEMLEIAGTGIAVGNADPKARAVANYIAEERYGPGVVEGLKYLQLL